MRSQLCYVRTRASVNFRLGNRAERREEIEIAALIGLADMLRIQRAIASRVTWWELLPGAPAAGKFFV